MFVSIGTFLETSLSKESDGDQVLHNDLHLLQPWSAIHPGAAWIFASAVPPRLPEDMQGI